MKISVPKALYHPKHWLSWLAAALLYLLVRLLPYHWLMWLGGAIGQLMERLMPYRTLISKTNIRLCFASSEQNWQTIYRRHVSSIGKGIFEMAMGWFLPPKHFINRVRHLGYEDADKALAAGRGVLFLGVHTTGLDFGAPLLNSRYPTYFMYRKANNAVLDYIIMRGRLRSCPGVIEHTQLRDVFTRLKTGQCVWYGCDQDFGDNAKSVFAPFFDVSAYTLPYYAKIARQTGAAVIPVAGFRDEQSGQFVVKYLPEIIIDDLSEQQAAEAMNRNIEQLISGYEEQYYWVHRRFKTRPDGEADLYPRKPSHIRQEKKHAKKHARQQAKQKK